MKAHLQYAWYIIRHKWYVFVECCKLGIPWLGIIHDWTKLTLREWTPYVRFFYGGPYPTEEQAQIEANKALVLVGVMLHLRTKEEVQRDFDIAWLYHQKRNRHHWQWWLLTTDQPGGDWKLGEANIESGLELLHKGASIFCETAALQQHLEDMAFTNPANARLINDTKAALNRLPVPLPMPNRYRREMLADWRGAGKALGKPDTKAWYMAHQDDIILHPDTRQWIEQQLGIR